MKEKVTKRLETNVAELLMMAMIVIVLLSSCGSAGYCIQGEALNPLSKQYSRTCY
tara:strand:+ start:714 stop:878 length:165 start_codon:yes stop_codon:yes gene_type:complete